MYSTLKILISFWVWLKNITVEPFKMTQDKRSWYCTNTYIHISWVIYHSGLTCIEYWGCTNTVEFLFSFPRFKVFCYLTFNLCGHNFITIVISSSIIF
jgi:hypothetical protein